MSPSARIIQGDDDTRQAYEAVTLRLARERVTDDRPLRDVLKDVTATAASALRVQRVSVWFFVDEPLSIRCDYLHQRDRGESYEGAILHACDFPVYFAMLESSRVVRCIDRDGDPMSEEFRASYLQPLGITAMLDAPMISLWARTNVAVAQSALNGVRLSPIGDLDFLWQVSREAK